MNEKELVRIEISAEDAMRIVVALESAAKSLGDMASRPVPMRDIEKRLEKAVEVHDQVTEIVVDEAKASTKKTSSKKESVTTDGKVAVGVRVAIETERVNNGCIGTIQNITPKGWITVTVEEGNGVKKKGENISVREKECKVLAGSENVETSDVTEVLEEEIKVTATDEFIVDESDANHPGNWKFDAANFEGETVHNVYTYRDGRKYVLYCAFKATNRPTWNEPCKTYLALHGITEHPER